MQLTWQLTTDLSSSHDGRPSLDALRDAVTRNAISLVELLHSRDRENLGIVTRSGFHHAIVTLGIPSERHDIFSLFNSWDPAEQGWLELPKLFAILRRGGFLASTYVSRSPKAAKARSDAISQRELMQSTLADERLAAEKALISNLRKRGMRLVDLENEWDPNSDGHVSREEFRRAIEKMGLFRKSDQAIDELFDHWDDGTGCLSMDSLRKRLRKSGVRSIKAPSRIYLKASWKEGQTLQDQVGDQLKELLYEAGHKVIDLLRDWDENADGVVSKSEFKRAIVHLGFEGPSEEVETLFDAMDEAKDGELTYSVLEAKMMRHGQAASTRKRREKIEQQKRASQEEKIEAAAKAQARILDARTLRQQMLQEMSALADQWLPLHMRQMAARKAAQMPAAAIPQEQREKQAGRPRTAPKPSG